MKGADLVIALGPPKGGSGAGAKPAEGDVTGEYVKQARRVARALGITDANGDALASALMGFVDLCNGSKDTTEPDEDDALDEG